MAIRKLSQQYLLMDYPVTINEMERILPELPKTERTYFEYAFKALCKIMSKDEKIYNFNIADPKLIKTGYIVVAGRNLVLLSLKGGLFGGMNSEIVKYEDIKNIDFDVTPSLFGQALMNKGEISLEMKGLFGGTNKRVIRNIPEENLDNVVKSIRDKITI